MVQQQLRAPHKKWKHMVAVMCFKSHVQETRQNNITKAVQKISQSRSVPAWQIEDTTGDAKAVGHVGGAV